jgi:hypothetical protein
VCYGFHGSLKTEWPRVLVCTVSYALQIINVLFGILKGFQKTVRKPLCFDALTK